MQASQETCTHKDFSNTARDFQQWRATRRRGARIPATLWRSATSLAVVHGVSRTALALGLDYYALKKRLGARSRDASASAIARGTDPERQFVEVSLPSATSTFTCAIEVEKPGDDAGHSKLRLELEDVALGDLDALLRSVWSQRA
jgi:hypothetical protein